MKILVLGCNGMAGHMMSLVLQEDGAHIDGLARKNLGIVNTIKCDVCDFTEIEKIIVNGKYNVVINCIGILNKSAENDKANAVLLNSYLPHFLAKVTKNSNTKIIHISTDCVFSGEKGQYTETELCDGRSFYARSKALGELVDDKNLTIRTSIVGPDIKSEGIGLLNWFMQSSGKITGYDKVIWTGQTTLQLAKTVEAAISANASGLYNMVPNFPISKYELLCLFNKYLRKNKIIIIKDNTIKNDKSLYRSNYEFSYELPSYEIMVSNLAEWMKKHRKLYAHYSELI